MQQGGDDDQKKHPSSSRPKSILSEIGLPEKPSTDANNNSSGSKPNVSLGEADKSFKPQTSNNIETGGMIMGPNHPVFKSPSTLPSHSSFARRDRKYHELEGVPPGARYDPVAPFPGTGEPDNDELIPPNGEQGTWEMGPDGKPRLRVDRNAKNQNGLGNWRIPKPPGDPFGGGSGGQGMGSGAPFFD